MASTPAPLAPVAAQGSRPRQAHRVRLGMEAPAAAAPAEWERPARVEQARVWSGSPPVPVAAMAG